MQLAGRTVILLEEDEVRPGRMRSAAAIAQTRRNALALRGDEARTLADQVQVPEKLARDEAGSGAEVVRQLDLTQLGAERRSCEERTAAERGRGEGLGKGPEENQTRMLGEEQREVLPAEVAIRLVDSDQRLAGNGQTIGLRKGHRGAGRIVGRADEDELCALRRLRDLLDGEAERSIGLPEPHLDHRGAEGPRLQGVERVSF